MKPTLAALSIALAAAIAAPAAAADLTLAFSGIETPKGQLMIAVYDSEAAYDSDAGDGKDKAVRTLCIDVDGPTAAGVLKDLAPGRYAFKLFHDIDGDKTLKTNPFGIPTEPYAFSNNAPANMGPAKWAKAAFDLAEPGVVQTITVR